MRYKGINIYSVDLWKRGYGWRVQTGHHVIGTYKTLGAAKAAVTRYLKD